MVRPADLIEALEQDDVSAARDLIAANEKVLHTYVGRQRDWGVELCLPLHLAVEACSVEMVSALLDRGAMPDSRTRFETPLHARRTTLHFAAARGDLAILDLLLNHPAEVEVLDADQRTPVTEAAAHNQPGCLARLLEAGGTVDRVDLAGRTPLHHAIRAKSVACAKMLIEAGADVDHPCPKEPEAFTPLHRCVAVGEEAYGIAVSLLAADADRALTDPRENQTALDRARAAQMQSYIDLLAGEGS
ncbi:ankyrin repeat domain-containing protein [Mucisphaera sp.]|uniref:ankyrin repeat domain-containing protein n=1 Tax=Mucisphaera sp. TaxID=2913024 RepID=UPI003D13CC4D